MEVGFFERRQAAGGAEGYRVPFLYRDALELVQGTEGGAEVGEDEEDEVTIEDESPIVIRDLSGLFDQADGSEVAYGEAEDHVGVIR